MSEYLSRGDSETVDVVVVGAGAAGLAASIFCARHAPAARVVVLDGAKTVGAKILVSGGSRCNVTNRDVTDADFWGGSRRVVRHVLRAFSSVQAAGFFTELGVSLHEEEDGKLFPDTNKSRTVLTALLNEADRLGVQIRTGARVTLVDSAEGGFHIHVEGGAQLSTARVVLATGGRSLPKTGSDGAGYELARRLGHGYVPTTPALVPLILNRVWHAVPGVTQSAELIVRIDGSISTRLSGSMLWTHFGVSGPVVLNASRHWHRAELEGRRTEILLNSCPGETFAGVEQWLLEQQAARPRALLATVLSSRLPAALASSLTAGAVESAAVPMAQLDRPTRRSIVRALTELPLHVKDSRGYNYAEVTAGGIPLDEIDSRTMESRLCSGLHLVGEVLDVDGRLGGFNFQWAWSSGYVAGTAIARCMNEPPEPQLGM